MQSLPRTTDLYRSRRPIEECSVRTPTSRVHRAGRINGADRAFAEDFVDRALEVRHRHDFAVLPDREHPRLRAHRMDVGAGRAVASGRQHAVVDFGREAHLPRMNLEDRHPGFEAGQRNVDNPVESTRAKECLVEDVRPVRRPDDLDLSQRVEPVQLREELHQGPLDLPVPGSRDLEALRADRVELVDEHDRRSLLSSELEQLPDEPRALADVLLDELGSDEPDERRLRAVRDRLREERLPGARWPDQEDAFWRLNANLPVQVRFQQRILHGLAQLAHLDFEAADVFVRDGGLLDDLRARDDRIERRRQHAHHRERLLVQRDPRADDQVLFRDVVRRVDDEIGPGGRLHHDAAIREDVADVPDGQRRTLEPVELLLEPANLFLEAAEFGLDVPLLALRPPGGLQELVVAVLQRGNPLRHFLRELANLVIVHGIIRWVGGKTKAIYSALFI